MRGVHKAQRIQAPAAPPPALFFALPEPRRLEDYANHSNHLRDFRQTPGMAETAHLDHVRAHYCMRHEFINPRRIVPLGPAIDFRGRMIGGVSPMAEGPCGYPGGGASKPSAQRRIPATTAIAVA